MKHSIFLLSIFSVILISNKTFAQGEAAVPFLLLQPSPSLRAMGQTGTALPTDDPFGFIWNPAQLGYASQKNNFSFMFYPAKTNWHLTNYYEIELNGIAFNAGYNLKDFMKFPLSIGVGYSKFTMIGDANTSFESQDYYHAYSLGVGIDYSVQFNAGFTFKSITSILTSRPVGQEFGEGKAEPNVVDFGILINIPVINLIDDGFQIKLTNNLSLKPDFNFSVGYTKSNIGDEVYYIDPAQADPLPRVDRLGYGISSGFDVLSDNFQMKLINFSFTVEADDILIAHDSTGWDYQSTFSDLKLWKNIIRIEGNEKIVSHIGLKFDLFETVSFSTGHFSGRGFDESKTNGFELRTKGIFKLWALWAKDPFTDFLRDHIDIRYYNTNYFKDDYSEPKMTGLAVYIHNLNSLF